MGKLIAVAFLATFALVAANFAQGQQARLPRVGVILPGGPYHAAVDGLRDGLNELGLAEGRHYVLQIRDLKGNRKAVEEAARALERDNVDLIYAIAIAPAVKEATTAVPIVFVVGSDPIASGLIESLPKPGGRATGILTLVGDLTAKRLEVLRAILPKLSRVVTFYDPGNAIAVAGVKAAREASRQLNIEIVERHVRTAEELRRGVLALKTQDADAYFHANDSVVTSQAQFIIDTARARKLPTIFPEQSLAEYGALVGYGVSYFEAGRLSAKYVQRILSGTRPQDLPVESLSRIGLAVNLKTAQEIGVTIPQAVLLRADNVIR